jgi:hypothetical protein
MERIPVTSSSIASIGHDPTTNTLHVEFKNGRVYAYADVSAAHHAALLSAESIGAHFGKHIRGAFTHTKLDPEPVHETGRRG